MASHGVSRPATTEKRTEQARQKELSKIVEYTNLVDSVQDKIAAKELTAETFALTSKLLSLNPEFYTIWNHRRIVLLNALLPSASNPLSLLSSDLQFLIPLLRQFPKCYWIWKYRLWLLQTSTRLLRATQSRELWKAELALCGQMLARDSRNFHGWGYRRHVVRALETEELGGKSMAEEEFAYTTKMTGTNLSNFSAWHARGTLLPRVLNERGATLPERIDFYRTEQDRLHDALFTDPYDSSLWAYHATLFDSLDNIIGDVKKNILHNIRCDILEQELDFIVDLLEEANDCKWIYEAAIRFSLIHKRALVDGEKNNSEHVPQWLLKLQELDRLRGDRWKDWTKELKDEGLLQ